MELQHFWIKSVDFNGEITICDFVCFSLNVEAQMKIKMAQMLKMK